MKPEAQEIALAILARVQEQDGIVNKTKLLKLLYLADIEHYRTSGETLTGFDWILHYYGPWSGEYDNLLDGLVQSTLIAVDSWSNGDREGARIRVLEPRDLNKIIKNTDEFFRIQHQVDCWRDRSLSELLDYVYFETEPMVDAVNGQRLRFDSVVKDGPKLYRRAKSTTHPEALKRLRLKMQELRKRSDAAREVALKEFRSPVFDDIYAAALTELDGEVGSTR